MKLIYELDQANRAAFEAAGDKDEKILYCIPYEYEEHGMVDGYVVLTPTHLYKLRDGSLAAKWDMQRMSDFSVETLYGCGLNIYYLFLIKCTRFVEYFNKAKLTPMLLTER